MTTILLIHSLLRWLIILLAIVAIIKFTLGWLQNQEFQKADRAIMGSFVGFIDLQLLIGLILLIGYGSYTRHQFEHLFTMVILLLVVHLLPRRWRDAPAAIRFRNNLGVIIAALVLIVLGVMVLPGNRWALPF